MQYLQGWINVEKKGQLLCPCFLMDQSSTAWEILINTGWAPKWTLGSGWIPRDSEQGFAITKQKMKTKMTTVILGTYIKALPSRNTVPTAAQQKIRNSNIKKKGKNEDTWDRNTDQQNRLKGLKREMYAWYRHNTSSEKTCFISTELREQSSTVVLPHD